MYYYIVGYGSPEDSDSIVVCHDEEWTQAEFQAIVCSATVAVLNDPNNCMADMPRFEYQCREAVKYMCSHMGFTKPLYTAVVSPFGWADLDDPADWGRDWHDDDLVVLRAAVMAAQDA
jgi:hypothetical protein